MARTPKIETPPEVVAAKTAALAVVPKAELDAFEFQCSVLAVTTPVEYEQANELLGRVKSAQQKVEEYWGPKIAAAHAVHKMLCDAAAEFRKPLTRIESAVKNAMTDYRMAEERKRQQALAEAARQAEQAQKDIEAEARKLKRAGKISEANELLQAKETIVPVAMVPEATKAEGTRERWGWEHTVVDKMALIKAVAEGKVPPDALEPNDRYIRKYVDAAGDKLAWPGVAVKPKLVLARATEAGL